MHKYLLLFIVFPFIGCSQKVSKKEISFFENDKETGWYRVKDNNNKWGFVDKDTLLKIPFEYDFVNPFDENGLAYAKNDGKELYIDKNGKIVITPDYDQLGLFSEGLLSAKKNKKYGFLNTKGSVVIPFIYEGVGFFCQGLATASKNSKYGFINSKGKEIIPIVYDAVDNSHTDLIVTVSKNKKWAFFDHNGKQLSEFVYDKVFSGYNLNIPPPSNLSELSTYFKNGAVLVTKNNKFEFLNEQIQPAFPDHKFDSASVFDTYKNAIVKRNDKYGIIKPDGTAKVPIEYDFIEYFDTNHNSSEYYNARKGSIYHIYNKDLRKIGESYQPVYNDFSVLTPFIVFENLQKKYGMVSSIGEIVIPFEYEELQKLQTGYFLGKKNGKSGILDKNGKIKVPFKYDDLQEYDEGLFIADRNEIIDINNKTILSGYDRLSPIYYNSQKFIVSKNKKFGIVDDQNKILLPLEFDEISNWVEYGPDGHFVIKNGKYGLIENETFKIIIPYIYDELFYNGSFLFARKNRKAGILNINNKEICPFIFDEIKPGMSSRFVGKEEEIYAKKGNNFYLIDIKGTILKQVTSKVYKDKNN